MDDRNFFIYDNKYSHSKAQSVFKKDIMWLSDQALYLAKRMNGKTSDEELKEEFKTNFKLKLSDKNLAQFLNELRMNKLLIGRTHGYLSSKLGSSYRKKIKHKFDKKRIIEANCAGICYKDNPGDLFADLTLCLSLINASKVHALCRGIKSIKGIIVPHSNIELSGQCAAWAYHALADYPLPGIIIILGVDHFNRIVNPGSVVLKDFRTPLGIVKVDRDFGMALAHNCDFNVFDHCDVFLREHSIELQLPFLQYIYRHDAEHVRILPVLCNRSMWASKGFADKQERFIGALKKTIIESGRRALVIASGDLVHNPLWKPGPMFHKRNREIITLLKTGKADIFKCGMCSKIKYASCSRMQFYTLLRLLEPSKGLLLNYSWTSNSKLVDKNRAKSLYENSMNIGYAGMVFY